MLEEVVTDHVAWWGVGEFLDDEVGFDEGFACRVEGLVSGEAAVVHEGFVGAPEPAFWCVVFAVGEGIAEVVHVPVEDLGCAW